LKVALVGDEQSEGQRDDLRETERDEARSVRARQPFTEAGRQSQSRRKRPPGSLHLQIEGLGWIQVRANAVPVSAAPQDLPTRPPDAVPLLETAQRACGARPDVCDNHPSGLEHRDEPQCRNPTHVTCEEECQVADIGPSHHSDAPADRAQQVVGFAERRRELAVLLGHSRRLRRATKLTGRTRRREK